MAMLSRGKAVDAPNATPLIRRTVVRASGRTNLEEHVPAPVVFLKNLAVAVRTLVAVDS